MMMEYSVCLTLNLGPNGHGHPGNGIFKLEYTVVVGLGPFPIRPDQIFTHDPSFLPELLYNFRKFFSLPTFRI
jgi:hypothetical protein